MDYDYLMGLNQSEVVLARQALAYYLQSVRDEIAREESKANVSQWTDGVIAEDRKLLERCQKLLAAFDDWLER